MVKISKRLKKILLSLAVIIIGLVGLRLYINSILKEVIYEEVKSFSKNNYKLNVENIKVGVLAFNATIEGFNLQHIPHKADSLIPYGNIKAKAIRLRGLNLSKLIFNRSLNLARFELIDPKIDIYYTSKNNDTSSTKAAVELFTVQIKKLKLTNVEINLYNLGESTSSIKAKYLYYDIKSLKLEIKDIWINHAKKDSSKLLVALDKGHVDGFYLNQLINKRTFRYDEIRFSKMTVAISKNKNTEKEFNEKTEKVKNISQSKFFTSIEPVSIEQLSFSLNSRNKKIIFKGNDLTYSNRDFLIRSFNLDIDQNFKTSIISKELKIKGMDADSINDGYNIAVDLLELQEPRIKLALQNKSTNEDTGSSILKLFNIKRVNSLILKKGNVEITHKQKKLMKVIAANIELSAKNVLPDKGFIYFDNASFSITNLFYNLPSNLYNYKIAKISYSQTSGNASITNLQLTPNHSKNDFPKIVAKQVARITLGAKSIELQNLNIMNLVNNHVFNCNKVVIDKLKAEFYKDKNIPLLATDYKKFPQEIIRDFDFGLNINTIEIKNSVLTSEVLSPNASNTGNIEVDQVNMVLKGVDNTNSTSNILNVTFSGRLAKTGLINATVQMPIHDKLCNHTAHIEIDKMPFSKINSFINEVVHVSIDKGQLDKAIIDIKGNKTELNCKLELRYHDLNMKILADESTSKNANKLNLANKLANSVIINSNPTEGKPVRISETKINTEINKFIINNWIAVTLNSMMTVTAPSAINLINKTKTRRSQKKVEKQ